MKRRFKTKRKKYPLILFYLLFLMLIFILINNIKNKFDYSSSLNGKTTIKKINLNRKKILLGVGLNIKEKVSTVIPTFNEVVNIRKKVYLYNTHQTEEYADSSVYYASKMLKEKLDKLDIDADVCDVNIKLEMQKNNYIYSQSYRVTRAVLEPILEDDYSLYIDIHRDSSKYEASTVKINDKSYAKMMFVVGAKHENYKNNYEVVENLNRQIKNINKDVSRGIYVQKSSSYNQDLDSRVVLIEVGGPYNTLEEVSNSMDVLAEAIKSYLDE